MKCHIYIHMSKYVLFIYLFIDLFTIDSHLYNTRFTPDTQLLRCSFVFFRSPYAFHNRRQVAPSLLYIVRTLRALGANWIGSPKIRNNTIHFQNKMPWRTHFGQRFVRFIWNWSLKWISRGGCLNKIEQQLKEESRPSNRAPPVWTRGMRHVHGFRSFWCEASVNHRDGCDAVEIWVD